ncbi:MAG TPA: hypothetical protein VE173_07710 [Longimicrobiales bacterium]|nr:hypothetical protein [Longimicrobiales bacterium]
MKKGRHRRFEEARAFKHQSSELTLDDELLGTREPCPECGAQPGAEHASWCLHEEYADEEEES